MGFFRFDDIKEKEIMPGIHQKVLTGRDDKVMLVWYRIEKDTEFPTHDHPHEQAGIIIEGEARFKLGDIEAVLGPGEGWSIPGGQTHGAFFTKESNVIDVFHPPREDFLED